MKETLPVIQFDGVLSIRPPGGSQIPIYKIKKLVFVLREMGYPIEWVSLDGFQSADFIQTMKRAGIKSGLLSLDRTPNPYMNTKQAILDGRVTGVAHSLVKDELNDLVWVADQQKVDHTPSGSKDVADTVAGVIHGLSIKRMIWAAHGVNPNNATILGNRSRVDDE